MQHTVTICFLIDDESIQFQASVLDEDGFAVTMTAAKLVTHIDFRKLSLDQSCMQVVNWENTKSGTCDAEELKYIENPMYYVWCNFFTKSPLWDTNGHSFYIVELEEQDLMHFNNYALKPIPLQIQQVVAKKEHLITKKTIVFLNFKDHDLGRCTPPNTYIDTVAIFNGLYRRKQEEWLVYNVTQGQYPSKEVLERTSAIILPGSSSSVYNPKPWIREVTEFLLDCHANYDMKFLGICFGFQLLAQAFGGQVSPMKNRIRFKNYHMFGNCVITQGENNWIINKAHGDYVTELPEKFINIGNSKSITNEVFRSNDNRILAFQSHPEYSTKLLQLYAQDYKSKQLKIPFRVIQADSDFNKFFEHPSSMQANIMCLTFIKS